jgi:hypothetical protein
LLEIFGIAPRGHEQDENVVVARLRTQFLAKLQSTLPR